MKLLKDINPSRILFLDIETVPMVSSFDKMSPEFKVLWDKKSSFFRTEEQSAGDVFDRAGIYAEFGKIICISVGIIKGQENNMSLRIKSFFSHNEKELLDNFSIMLNNFSTGREAMLCAHNGKEFDYPFIARRMIINGLRIPAILDNAGKKPWEINLLDTMELWKFGDYKNYTSLELIAGLLEVPTPKDDIDGSMVAETYWKENDINRIARYCEKDVIALTQVFLKFRNNNTIPGEKIESVTQFID
ncbi:MAG TPA: 3'-5' exonuclease [Bacteroidales bacterium]|nr:3'-5' exonuclease [Bacteroidales bacterium]